MNYRIAFGALATLMVACSGDTDSKPTDSGITTPTDTETGSCSTTYSGPVTVEAASVACAGTDVTIDIETAGWTSAGRVHQRDNRNNNYWSDNHDLASYAFDPCGAYDMLDVTLATGAAVADWADGVSTVFTCAGHYEVDVMSYAAGVWDFDGAFADCLAWGYDPQEIIDNPDAGVGEPADFDVSGCVIGTSTM